MNRRNRDILSFQVLISRITRLCREICQPLGVTVVANQRVCDPEVVAAFAESGVLCVDRLGRDGREALIRVSGATTVCSLGRGQSQNSKGFIASPLKTKTIFLN